MKEENKKDYFVYSEIKSKPVEWLWFPYIPKGMVSIVEGDPKCGKTFMLIDIASRITKGDYMPFSNERFEIGNIIFLNSDDPIEYTLAKRFEKQGADISKIFSVNENDKKLYFKDLTRLENLIKEKQPQLIVIDPIQAYMGDSDINSMVQVRNSLSPLKRIAEEYNCAIVLVRHLKKGMETKAIYKGIGSMDFIGFARSVLMVLKNEDDKSERLLCHVCSNVEKEGNCLSFKIGEEFEWVENKGDIDIDNLVQEVADTKVEYAKNFIIGCLSTCEKVSANDLQKAREKGGFSSRTFDEAKSRLVKLDVIDKFKNNGNWWKLKINSKVQSCKEEVVNKNDIETYS